MELPNWIPNWTDLTLYHYLAIAGAALVLVALLLHFTPIARLKMPAVLLGVVGGLGTGIALGVLSMASIGYHFKPSTDQSAQSSSPGMGAMIMPPAGPPGMPGAGMRGGGGRAMGGGRGPNPKTQLVALVTKLDQLSGQPLQLTLSVEQKKKVEEQLQELDKEKELKPEDAQKRLDALRKVLDPDQLNVLDVAGYRWPSSGQGGGGRPPAADQPNPFTQKPNADHLKSLRAHLDGKKTEK